MQEYKITSYISGFKSIQKTVVKGSNIEEAIKNFREKMDCYAATNIMKVEKL